MTIIRPNKMPAFWWVCPWAYARTLHMSANALKAYADRLDEQLEGQRQTIKYLLAENYVLQQRVADQNDAIIRGTAITPDAHPHE
jgi:cell division protein FtsB